MSLGSGGPSSQDTAEGVDVVVVREVGAARYGLRSRDRRAIAGSFSSLA
jgi:hypothetical protein